MSFEPNVEKYFPETGTLRIKNMIVIHSLGDSNETKNFVILQSNKEMVLFCGFSSMYLKVASNFLWRL